MKMMSPAGQHRRFFLCRTATGGQLLVLPLGRFAMGKQRKAFLGAMSGRRCSLSASPWRRHLAISVFARGDIAVWRLSNPELTAIDF
jgi:hypothetical protein